METFNERVKKRRLELKLSQAALGRRAGVPQSTIGQIENGRNKSNTKILELAAALQTTPEYLLNGTKPDNPSDFSTHSTGKRLISGCFSSLPQEEYVLIPLYHGSGPPAVSGTVPPPPFKLAFSRSILKQCRIAPEDTAYITVVGKSMEPVLPEKTTVGIHLKDICVSDGQIYAIRQGNLIRIKRLYLIPDNMLRINSYNQNDPAFQDEIVPVNTVEIIGRVFWWSVLA